MSSENGTEPTEMRPESAAAEPSQETPSTSASATSPVSPRDEVSETAEGTPRSAEASGEGARAEGAEDHEDGEGDEGVEGEGAEGAAAGEPGADGQKKKRRRRRKKKGGEPQLGPDGQPLPVAAQPQQQQQHADRQRRDQNALPFSRYFPETGGRRHILSPGEAVAGRVLRVERGCAVIDLFGRGIAFTSANEPREIPAPPPEEEHHESAASDPQQVGDAMAKMDGHVGMPASESLPPPPPVDPGSSPDMVLPAEDPAEPGSNDPHAIGRAAKGLLQVGTPQLDSDGDGIPDDLDPTPHGEGSGSESHGTSAGREEAPAMETATESPPIEVGSVFRGRIAAVSENGSVALYNHPFLRSESRLKLAQARQEHRRVFGIVYGYNRGGFDVLVDGLRAFCPISGLTLDHIEDPEPLIGQRLEFSVQQAKSGHQGVVVSRRGILEREARKKARELRKNLKVGQVLEGRVTQVRDFGLIVDLGGIEGLVHMSEVSWDRAVRPQDAAKPGDEVKVQIVRLGAHDGPPQGRGGREGGREGGGREGREGGREAKSDRRRDGRIGLSIKACLPDPFESELKDVTEGTIKKGKVMRVAEFGAFVEIAPGVEGLLHVSELGKDLKHAGERIKEGEEIVVCIDRIDIKARRVALSKLSDADAKLWLEGTLPAVAPGKAMRMGSMIKVRVEKIESFGLQVQVDGVPGKKGRGFIPNAEMGTERGTDHRKKFPVGTEIDVKVVSIERDGSLRCSRKAFFNDEERKAIQDYRREASAKGFGTFGDLLKRKIKG